MSFVVTFTCPLHPSYQARVRPNTTCKACAAMFAGRNELHKILSTPVLERREPCDIVVASVE